VLSSIGEGKSMMTFQENLREFIAKYVTMWWDTETEMPVLGERFEPRQQGEHEQEADRLIDDLVETFQRCPDSEAESDAFQEEVKTMLQRFGKACLGLPDSYLELICSQASFEATRAFVRQARAFDKTVKGDELLQALRNVWTMSSGQMFLNLEIGISPSIFAYSMLYLYTDNYLDDPEIPGESKREINRRLGLRLAGNTLTSRNSHEKDLFRLVALIESEYPRCNFPQVYMSLLAIHSAQVRSLSQQGRLQSPYETDILRISVHKGGTSVLAQGYLEAGNLSKAEGDFFFGYGVLLQLLDDLQDLRDDREAKRMTIFSQTAGIWPLDGMTSRLYRFIERVLESAERFSDPRFDILKGLIKRNCTFLMLRAIAEHHEWYSAGYVQEMETYSPLRFAFLRQRSKTVKKKFEKVKQTLTRKKHLDSVFDVFW